MGIQREGIDTYQVRKFGVRIDRIAEGDFVDCTPIEVDSAVSEYRTGTDPDWKKKQPGGKNYPDVTLTRGEMYLAESFLAQWEANKDRRAVEIYRLNHEGDVEGKVIKLHGAFPRGYKTGEFDATSDDGLAIETIVIAYEYAEFI